jgi:hypothetical protein
MARCRVLDQERSSGVPVVDGVLLVLLPRDQDRSRIGASSVKELKSLKLGMLGMRGFLTSWGWDFGASMVIVSWQVTELQMDTTEGA